MSVDNIRPLGTVQVQCSTPHCLWEFWLPSDDIRLPHGPFFCDACAEHARYEFVCSHRQTFKAFEAELNNPRSLLRHALNRCEDAKLRITIEKILPSEN